MWQLLIKQKSLQVVLAGLAVRNEIELVEVGVEEIPRRVVAANLFAQQVRTRNRVVVGLGVDLRLLLLGGQRFSGLFCPAWLDDQALAPKRRYHQKH